MRAETPPLLSHQAPVHVAAVTLLARDLAGLAAFYEERVGLERVAEAPDRVSLGAGGVGVLHLLAAPDARPEPVRAAGLFHIAFLLPSRAALGQWFRAAHGKGTPFDGASDHGVSEAFYLTDPEGNGVEVYADRPRDTWRAKGAGFDLTTERMDLPAVIEAGLALGDGDGRFPAAARIGHVHLKVGDIGQAEAFYAGRLGLDIVDRRPGGTFYSTGGYHHHIATNTWASARAGPRPEGVSGLAGVHLAVGQRAWLDAAAERLGAPTIDGRLEIRDPWGIALTLELAGP